MKSGVYSAMSGFASQSVESTGSLPVGDSLIYHNSTYAMALTRRRNDDSMPGASMVRMWNRTQTFTEEFE
jgi:hypothetical protein